MGFFQSIKINLQNGTFANATNQLSKAFLQAGMTSAMFDQMKNGCGFGSSIFTGGCCNNFGMYGGTFGYNNWFSPYNPNVNPMMIGMPNYQNMMNSANVQYGNALAYNYGAMCRMNDIAAAKQQSTTQVLAKTQNKYAGDIDKNQSTELGKAFDAATSAMIDKDGEAIDGKKYEILKGGIKSEDKKEADKYRNAVSELGKSYLAEMDKTSGNNDGKVTLEEFTKYEMAKLDKNASDNQKAQAKTLAQIAFNQIDQNGDGYADWKELAATIATYDQDSEGKLDGIITSKEHEQANKSIAENYGINFGKNLRTNYQTLFGKKTE